MAVRQRQHLHGPETRDFGTAVGFVMCTTPPHSPESNGMAKSFVESFKRDYVYLANLWTAEDVLAQLPLWLADYNQIRPHNVSKCSHPLNSETNNRHMPLSGFVGGNYTIDMYS